MSSRTGGEPLWPKLRHPHMFVAAPLSAKTPGNRRLPGTFRRGAVMLSVVKSQLHMFITFCKCGIYVNMGSPGSIIS
jgi:hypothetical protein